MNEFVGVGSRSQYWDSWGLGIRGLRLGGSCDGDFVAGKRLIASFINGDNCIFVSCFFACSGISERGGIIRYFVIES